MNWRRWHRWLGTVAGLLLLLIGLTGILLQIDEVTGLTAPPKQAPVDESRLTPVDPAALAARVREIVEKRHGNVRILSFTIEAKEQGPIAIVRFARPKDAIEINLRTGEEKRRQAREQPRRSQLQRLRLLILNLHTFGLVGAWGHVLGMAVSAILVFLGGSGLWLWAAALQERRRRNKRSWFWH